MLSIMVPGPLSTIQDLGVCGFLSEGFSQTGAMDRDALRKANLLVLNNQNEACIEMTLQGITAYFLKDTIIAITGADISPQINWEPIPMYKAVFVKKGSIFSSSFAKSGCRSYMAISGGFDIKEFMGSKSTNLKLNLGGFGGRKLLAGDIIGYNETHLSQRDIENNHFPQTKYTKSINLRVVLGPQAELFSSKMQKIFLKSKFSVSQKSDRMGIRLSGDVIEAKKGSDIISDGIAFGSVQIPPDGQPIILMADRQTTGGYAKIATLISVDLPLIAQAQPKDSISFEKVSLKTAQRIYRDYENEMLRLENKMKNKTEV